MMITTRDARAPISRLILCLGLIGLMTACAGRFGGGGGANEIAAQAAEAAAHADYARAATLYMQASTEARDNPGGRQYRLEAGLAAAQAGQAQRASRLLDALNAGALTDDQRARYNVAQKEIRIAGLSPGLALTKLPPPASGARPAVAQRVLEKRAALYFAENQLIEGIQSLVQRDVWLLDRRAARANDNRIYDKSLDAIALGLGPGSRAAQNADKTTRGWLALAAIGQRQFAGRSARDQALAGWQQRYPDHPAARTVLAQRFNYDTREQPLAAAGGAAGAQPLPGAPSLAVQAPRSNTVVLALPMSGRFSGAAQAIHDGFMFAYHAADDGMPEPQVIDTGNMDAATILRQADQRAAGILVGPLDKPKVTAIAAQTGQSRRPLAQSRPIPEIALNYSSQPVDRAGFYQFALSPEDEARSVARHAEDAGYTRGLALVPQGDWGDRVLGAFRQRFANGGGELVNAARYDASAHDHRRAIQSVLRGYQQDHGSADVVFVGAQPTQGRLIRSQLRYYHASALPMLSTSLIYPGAPDPRRDIDLNGVYFVDMPWILGHGPTITSRRQAANQRYGDSARSYARLFAMGMDAWLLTRRVAGKGLSEGDTFEGMSGVLAVRPRGRIQRDLAWAVFRGGKPKLLQMPSTQRVDTLSSGAAPVVNPMPMP